MPPVAPGVTAHHPPTPERRAAPGTVLLQGLQGVGRAGGLEATGIAQPGLEQQSIAAHHEHQRVARGVQQPVRTHCRAGSPGTLRARSSNCSSSRRAASASASERAETNCATAKGERKRTSHCPRGRSAACAANTCRICRFSRLRVTARLACRLGTTQPNQWPAGKSSTAERPVLPGPVDNSVAKPWMTALAAGLRAGKGPWAKWCRAK